MISIASHAMQTGAFRSAFCSSLDNPCYPVLEAKGAGSHHGFDFVMLLGETVEITFQPS